MRAGPYVPQPGTIPAKVVAYLKAQKAAGKEWVPAAELAEHIGQPDIAPYMVAPKKHGLIVARKRWDNLRLSEYALADGKPLPGPADQEAEEPLDEKPRGARTKPKPFPWPKSVDPVEVPASAPQPRRRGPAAGALSYADVDSMQITDDPIVPRTAGGGDKYGPIFARMRLGQAIACDSADAPKVGNALRKWRDEHHPTAIVRAVRHYPADNRGRVWLLPPVKGAKGARR